MLGYRLSDECGNRGAAALGLSLEVAALLKGQQYLEPLAIHTHNIHMEVPKADSPAGADQEGYNRTRLSDSQWPLGITRSIWRKLSGSAMRSMAVILSALIVKRQTTRGRSADVQTTAAAPLTSAGLAPRARLEKVATSAAPRASIGAPTEKAARTLASAESPSRTARRPTHPPAGGRPCNAPPH
jgi:hypothetical protein